jgi:ATPase subunit of ABC transporter with duplicated ATPase domains
MSALLTLDSVSLSSPDGRLLFSDLTLALGRERVGLVGRNGAGKSTLLRAIAEGTRPRSGSISVGGTLGALRQAEGRGSGRAADLLGVAEPLARLDRIQRGQGTAEDLAGADWLLPQRIDEALADVGLGSPSLHRPVSSFSGGERTSLALARLLLERPDVLLLDEPTNNLDGAGRQAVSAMLAIWRGGALVASHDRTLLEQMDRIVELSPVGVRLVGGGWSAYEAMRDAERDRAEQSAERAESELRAAKRAAQSARERQARRDSAGRAYAASGSAPAISLGLAKGRAETTAGRSERLAANSVDKAEQAREVARAALERVMPLSFSLPASGLPPNRVVLSLEDVVLQIGGRHLFGPLSFSMSGSERVAIHGRNGAGKSSLLKLITGALVPSRGVVRTGVPHAYLDQHVSLLLDDSSLLENLKHCQQGLSDHDAHRVLARFAFRNQDALRLAGNLSGGERLRAGLACMMCAAPPPQLLLLDEPTNHLDLTSIEALENAISRYDGALIVVSHDRTFLDKIAVERQICLN